MKTIIAILFVLIAAPVFAATVPATGVNVTWTDNSAGAQGFIIYRARGCESPQTATCNKPSTPFTEIGRVNPGVTSFNDPAAAVADCYVIKGFLASAPQNGSLPTNVGCVIQGPSGIQIVGNSPLQFAGTFKNNRITAASNDGYKLVATIGKRNQVAATVTR